MLAILNTVLPVFALIALGYGAVRAKLYPASGVHGLIAFVNNFATPCLLFNAMLHVDFGAAFIPGIIVPFYVGALFSLFAGTLLAIKLFANRPGEGVASGFSAMFTNTVLIGIPIVARAYGQDALTIAYSIIGFHAPLLITIGMLTMELMRRDGAPLGQVLRSAGLRIIQNPLLWGIALGALANILGLTLAEPLDAFVVMMSAAVLPVALFGLGGALNDYRLADNWPQALAMSAFKLIVHPAIAWVLMVPVFHVDPHLARIGVLLAAMPTGINAYVFATYYDRNVSVAANTILISTVLSVITVSAWLWVLGL